MARGGETAYRIQAGGAQEVVVIADPDVSQEAAQTLLEGFLREERLIQ